jgi:ferredoxin
VSIRLGADRDVCVGAGMCVRTAPALFDQDDELGLVVLLNEWPHGRAVEEARRAVDLCPSGALSFLDKNAADASKAERSRDDGG